MIATEKKKGTANGSTIEVEVGKFAHHCVSLCYKGNRLLRQPFESYRRPTLVVRTTDPIRQRPCDELCRAVGLVDIQGRVRLDLDVPCAAVRHQTFRVRKFCESEFMASRLDLQGYSEDDKEKAREIADRYNQEFSLSAETKLGHADVLLTFRLSRRKRLG